MRSYQHVMFDFDGVLCNSLAAAIDVFNDLKQREFPALPTVTGRDDMVEVYRGSLRTCLSSWLSDADHSRFFELHAQAMASRVEELHQFPGIEGMLEELPEQSVSVVTSAYSQAVIHVLARKDGTLPTSLYEIAGKERQQTKAEKLEGLIERLGLHPDDCLYIGDLESDVLYCREVPIDVMAVSYGYHPKWHLKQCSPTYLVDSVTDLRNQMRLALDARNAKQFRAAP